MTRRARAGVALGLVGWMVGANLLLSGVGASSVASAAAGAAVGAMGFAVLLLAQVERRAGSAALAALAISALATGVGISRAQEGLRGERRGVRRERVSPDRREVRGPRGEAVRFAVWSDCRGGFSVLERVVHSIADRRPHFHVGLGDLVGMARDYQFEILRDRLRAGVPEAAALLTAGNHDRHPFDALGPFAKVFGAPTWSMRAGPCLLVAVDTSAAVARTEDVDFATERFDEAPVAVHRILLCHHPLRAPPGRPDKSLPAGGENDRLRALATRHRATVFSGNFHGYADLREDGGFRQVVTGGAGSALEGDAPFHYVWVEAGAEGLRVERVDVAPRDAVSRAREAWLALRDEAPYAARRARGPSLLVAFGVATFLGSLLALAVALARRRHPSGDVASST
jgi:hypothetical protein